MSFLDSKGKWKFFPANTYLVQELQKTKGKYQNRKIMNRRFNRMVKNLNLKIPCDIVENKKE